MVALDGKPFTSNQGHRGLPPADLGLTPEQRFLMDLQGVSLGWGGWGRAKERQACWGVAPPGAGAGAGGGQAADGARVLQFLHLKGVLQGEELAEARAAAVRYATADPDSLPAPFDDIRRRCDASVHVNTPNTASHLAHAFAFDKSLEKIIFHERIWPILMEFTEGRPQLRNGLLVCEDHREGGHGDRPVHLHCAREDGGPRTARYEVANGRIFCDNFIVFPYFDDVQPGDGGLLVLPVSESPHLRSPRSPDPLPAAAGLA